MVDIELRRALCFRALMYETAPWTSDTKQFPPYIREKWRVISQHDCPEQVLHRSLREVVFDYLRRHKLWDKEYEKELVVWGAM